MKHFKWNVFATNLLIEIYAKRVDEFMSSSRKRLGKRQCDLWQHLIAKMRENDELDQKIKNLLTIEIVQRKWISLKKQLKSAMNTAHKNKSSIFPYYDRMMKLYTDYATRQLNATSSLCESVIVTSAAEVTSYILQLLDSDATSVTILSDISSCGLQSSNSESSSSLKNVDIESKSSKVRKKLTVIPEEKILIHDTKLRLDPITPFNRTVAYSLHQKAALQKRNLFEFPVEPKLKKFVKTIPTMYQQCNITNINQSAQEIKALDEFDFFQMPTSQITFNKDLLSESFHEEKSFNNGSILKIPQLNTNSFDVVRGYKNANSACQEEVIFAPGAFSPIFPNASDAVDRHNSSYTRGEISVFQKSMDSISSLPLQENHSSAPEWFKAFQIKYDADMQQLNNKIDLLNS